MIRTKRWQECIRQVLGLTGQGYVQYVHVSLPAEKAHRVEAVVTRLLQTYPEARYTRNQRYRHKRKGFANVALVLWERQIVVLRTPGAWTPRTNEDRFRSLETEPLVIEVGERVRVKVGRAKAGRRYTAFLARESYRWIRDGIREHIDAGDTRAAHTLWARAQKLPAFSGLAEQMRQLHDYLHGYCRRHKVALTLPEPRLTPAY